MPPSIAIVAAATVLVLVAGPLLLGLAGLLRNRYVSTPDVRDGVP